MKITTEHLSDHVDLSTISAEIVSWHGLADAAYAGTVTDGDHEYILVVEPDGAHGVWYNGGASVAPSYYGASCFGDPRPDVGWMPDAAQAWFACED